jgi:hypothetical protein
LVLGYRLLVIVLCGTKAMTNHQSPITNHQCTMFAPNNKPDDVPVPPDRQPPAPVEEPPDTPSKTPDAPVREPGPTPPKRL